MDNDMTHQSQRYQDAPADVRRMTDDLITLEGGYSDDPADPGGKTKYGVTEATARRHGYEGDMRELPVEFAREVYLSEYYVDPQFDRVASVYPDLAAELFDQGVNFGVAWPSRFLQRALRALNNQERLYRDIAVDGKIGDKTIEALAAFADHRGAEGGVVLFRLVDALQAERYITLAENNERLERFVYGWILNRVGRAR